MKKSAVTIWVFGTILGVSVFFTLLIKVNGGFREVGSYGTPRRWTRVDTWEDAFKHSLPLALIIGLVFVPIFVWAHFYDSKISARDRTRICPKCEKGLAPEVPVCPECNVETVLLSGFYDKK